MSKDYEAPDSDFYMNMAGFERADCLDNAYDERIPTRFDPNAPPFEKESFVEIPPTWQGTPSGRKQTTMHDFIKENFPNGMYIPGYMLHKRG